MFTDFVGSTPLAETLGDDAWQGLIRWHDQILRAIVSRHCGREVRQTGDGFLVAFEDASVAIEAAAAVQRSLAEHRGGHGSPPSSNQHGSRSLHARDRFRRTRRPRGCSNRQSCR